MPSGEVIRKGYCRDGRWLVAAADTCAFDTRLGAQDILTASLDRDRLRAPVPKMARLGKCVYARNFPGAQCLLQSLPVFDAHEIRMRAAERTTQRAVADPQTRLDLLGQKGHARLEEPGRHILLAVDRKSTRLNSSHSQISYAVFCLKKKNKHRYRPPFVTCAPNIHWP